MWFKRKTDFHKILREHLDKDFQVFSCGENPPSDSAIRDFETILGYQLPKDFHEYSTSRWGGAYVAVKEELWPRPKQGDVAPFWSFLCGLMVYGFASDIVEGMDMRRKTALFQQATGTRYAPFLEIIGDADVYCFDETQRILRWRHDESPEVVGKTFTEVFALELAELRKRKDRKLAEKK